MRAGKGNRRVLVVCVFDREKEEGSEGKSYGSPEGNADAVVSGIFRWQMSHNSTAAVVRVQGIVHNTVVSSQNKHRHLRVFVISRSQKDSVQPMSADKPYVNYLLGTHFRVNLLCSSSSGTPNAYFRMKPPTYTSRPQNSHSVG